MTEQDHQRVERELSLLIRRARSLSLNSASLVHPGLELTAYATLGLLETTGPMRASAIGEQFGLDKSTVSRQLSRLIDLGLVHRTPDPSDGRAHLVAITPIGHQRLLAISEERRAGLHRLLEQWDEKDVGDFGRLLEQFNQTSMESA